MGKDPLMMRNISLPPAGIEKDPFCSKTNQMHNFSSLLNITLHVSDGFSVYHQEFKTVHTVSNTCHTGSLTAY